MKRETMTIDHEAIMARVRAIAPILAENADACEQGRHVVPISLEAMRDAGMFRISQPARTAGYELSPRTLGQAVTTLSESCPSSAWVLMVIGALHWCLGHFPEAAQDEVLSNDHQLVAGTLALQGVATDTADGYRVSGRWQFASGVDHARWMMLGCADTARAGSKCTRSCRLTSSK
jgi:3-hydroxy-9,10-secoandrosta-1,3,5(10)-triene-9,17-dione monooxygenase